MKDNKGFSLVELLVAMAIASIVAGSISYFLVTSMRMYGNETADIVLQQELQTTLNQMMDYAMESQVVVLKQNDLADETKGTKYLALGTVSGNSLTAQIFWKDGNRLYLRKKTISDYKNTISGSKLNEKVNALIPSSPDNKYLLADYVDEFSIIPEFKEHTYSDGYGGTAYCYENPLTLKIKLVFEKTAANKNIKKEVTDRAVLRNHIRDTIYINDVPYTLKDLVAYVTEDMRVNIFRYLFVL